MAVKESVFGSKGEEKGFRSIEHTWGLEYRIFPQFPFSALFEPDESIGDTSNFFYKTSVDYVLCTQAGKPVLAVDFDGLGRGFNRDASYVQVEQTDDRQRKIKFDFKLRYAKKNNFPYYIVASDEFIYLDTETNLTIMDGLIGYELARRDFNDSIPSFIENHRVDIENMLLYERQEFIQDLVIQQEVESNHKRNRIIQKMDEVMTEIRETSGWNWEGSGSYYVHDPELPDLDYRETLPSAENLKSRATEMEKVEWVGFHYTLFDTPIGEVSAIVWMRNFEPAASVVQDIAEFLCWTKLSRRLGRDNVNR